MKNSGRIKSAVVVAGLLNTAISAVVLATGRLQSTWFGVEAFLVILWVFSGALLLVRGRSHALSPSMVMGLVGLYAIVIGFVVSPLLPYGKERRDLQYARATLRLTASEQEQFRLLHHRYASSAHELLDSRWMPLFDSILSFDNSNSESWSATARVGGATCKWGRRLSHNNALVGGHAQEPSCVVLDRQVSSSPSSLPIFSVFEGARFSFLTPETLQGSFTQHRFDAQHTAIVPGSNRGFHWRFQLDSELRASVSAVGDWVFAGAHGSGALAAINIRDGSEVWNVRVPNWIHHQPVIKSGVLVVGFGDNRGVGGFPTVSRIKSLRWSPIGSDPSGVEAYDAASGRLLWRRLTGTSVMASPVLYRDIAIGREAAGEIHAWDLKTGNLRWNTVLPNPSFGPMTNPVESHGNIFVTSDPGSWCVLRAISGEIVRCQSLSRLFYGPGHSTPAVDDSLLILMGIPSSLRQDIARIPFIGRPIGLDYSSVVVQAVNWNTGRTVWRRHVDGTAAPFEPGHIAGTPVIVGRRVVVSLPTIGEVASLDKATGSIDWRTKVMPLRGSLTVSNGKVIALTQKPSVAVLALDTGRLICEVSTRRTSDRAGLTIVGSTGIATFLDGSIIAAPTAEWLACSAGIDA